MTDANNAAAAITAALRSEFYDGVGVDELADAGRVAAAAAEPHHRLATYDKAADALTQFVDLHRSEMSAAEARGIYMARQLITDQRDALAEAARRKYQKETE